MTRTTKRATDVFKPAKRGDRLTACYLHGDGHVLAHFERQLRDLDKRVTYYKQIDSVGVACHFKGRIVFSGVGAGVAWFRAMLAAGAHTFGARVPSLEGGSTATEDRGMLVGACTAQTPFGDVTEYDLPGLISAGHHFQPDATDTFDASVERFGTTPVVETLLLAGETKAVAS